MYTGYTFKSALVHGFMFHGVATSCIIKKVGVHIAICLVVNCQHFLLHLRTSYMYDYACDEVKSKQMSYQTLLLLQVLPLTLTAIAAALTCTL